MPERRKLSSEPPLARDRTIRNEARVDEPPSGLSAKRGWLYAISAFVVLFGILWFMRAHARQSQNALPPGAAATKESKQPGAAWPTQTLTPDAKTAPPAQQPSAPAAATAPAPHATKPAAEPRAANGEARTIWRVVLYTYRRQQDAETKAHDIAARRPDLQAEVFSPEGAEGPFLVVAGGRLSRDAATRMRSRAVHEGMPRDSYIQNYSK
jgi:cytoskeletal protein RodZ